MIDTTTASYESAVKCIAEGLIFWQGSNHTEASQNSYLACTYPGYTSSFTIPRGTNVTTRLLQACSAAPESVAVATALSAQDSFPGWTPGGSLKALQSRLLVPVVMPAKLAGETSLKPCKR